VWVNAALCFPETLTEPNPKGVNAMNVNPSSFSFANATQYAQQARQAIADAARQVSDNVGPFVENTVTPFVQDTFDRVRDLPKQPWVQETFAQGHDQFVNAARDAVTHATTRETKGPIQWLIKQASRLAAVVTPKLLTWHPWMNAKIGETVRSIFQVAV
jgi:hypothetical protein